MEYVALCHPTIPELQKPHGEAEDHARGGTHHCLKNLIGQLQDGIFRGAVEEGTAQTVEDHLNHSPQHHAGQRAQSFLLRRGYSWEEIRAAMDRWKAENEDTE